LTDPAARELEALAILDQWDWSSGGCLIGGYAVSAYGRPRHSRDLDFVIPSGGRSIALAHLADFGFTERPLGKPKPAKAFRDAMTLRRGGVSIDMFFNQVKDRETKVSIAERWISSRC
jgi:hypothetical protein